MVCITLVPTRPLSVLTGSENFDVLLLDFSLKPSVAIATMILYEEERVRDKLLQETEISSRNLHNSNDVVASVPEHSFLFSYAPLPSSFFAGWTLVF